jgi:hypothetical protein
MKVAHAAVEQKEITRMNLNANGATHSTSVRWRTGNFLVYFLSVVLVGSAAVKLLRIPPVVSGMAILGFNGGKLILIAVLEIVSALLFAYPRTRSFGLLMLSAYLGGAIATHVGHDQLPLQPAIVLAVVWLAAWLRHRQLLSAVN